MMVCYTVKKTNILNCNYNSTVSIAKITETLGLLAHHKTSISRLCRVAQEAGKPNPWLY